MTFVNQNTKLARFYRFYLKEHQNSWCRRLHFFGNTLVLSFLAWCVYRGNYSCMWGILILGYGPAWVGHFVFEKNKPATFRYPGMSLICDWIMYVDMIRGRVKF